jgi:hypothetical protein
MFIEMCELEDWRGSDRATSMSWRQTSQVDFDAAGNAVLLPLSEKADSTPDPQTDPRTPFPTHWRVSSNTLEKRSVR